jgi:para-nitrobenzyl esterase
MNRILPLILAASAIASAAIQEPVRIDTGLVTGTTTSSDEVRVFKGIPYAAPPIGDLRWRAPQTAAKWDGVRMADQFSATCIPNRQAKNAPAPSENCLYINVWTPAKSASEKRAVFVWTYGGGFTGGSGSEPRYDGEALAKKGIVVVTYNYRLGAFGFFAHPELTKESGHNASGNYGMMDMAAALRWVQKNIGAFGGDPQKVTIGGESAGAFLVSAMVGSPEGKGLFKRAIAQSGAWMGISIGHMTTREQAEASGLKLAEAAGAKTLADLRGKSAEEIQKATRGGVGVVVDGWYIPEDLSLTFAKGKENDVDILVGSNRDEGTFFTGPGRGASASQFSSSAKERFGSLSDAYAKLYPSSTDAEAAESQLRGQRDEFGWHMREWAALQEKRGKDKAYLYFFTRVPPAPEGRPSRGATHTAELSYMFNNLLPGSPWTDVDRKLSDTMSSYWANFVMNGNPNGKGLPEWPVYSQKSDQAMILGDTVSVGTGIQRPVLAFYDSYYKSFMGGE